MGSKSNRTVAISHLSFFRVYYVRDGRLYTKDERFPTSQDARRAVRTMQESRKVACAWYERVA
jgi:hypothetical protein